MESLSMKKARLKEPRLDETSTDLLVALGGRRDELDLLRYG